jgi:hypothetical protein
MRSPREILRALVDAARDVQQATEHAFYGDVVAAVAALKLALDEASKELNRTHQLVIFVGKGKVTRALTDTETNMSCMVIDWDIVLDDVDYRDGIIDEITWSSTNTTTGKLLTNHLPCDVDPVIVGDVARTFEGQRLKALAELRNWKPFSST